MQHGTGLPEKSRIKSLLEHAPANSPLIKLNIFDTQHQLADKFLSRNPEDERKVNAPIYHAYQKYQSITSSFALPVTCTRHPPRQRPRTTPPCSGSHSL